MENIGRDLLLKQLRDCLNADKVKLWLPPYTTEDGQRGVVPEELIINYSQQLKFSRDEIAEGLEELRHHALKKLEERDKFKNHGIATLRIKMAGQLPTSPQNSSRKPYPLECSLDIRGSDLKALIGAQQGVSADLLKLISQGKVLDNNKSLAEQGIVNNHTIMAVLLVQSKERDEALHVKETHDVAKLLSSQPDDDEEFNVQIADQTGRPLSLPPEEKQVLIMALTFHEKGRAALKDKNFSLALRLFLEADDIFSKCREKLLKATENYAILCLDIVWCYLVLKKLDQLPDAENRLLKSEKYLGQCYGEKMERLASIQGETATEQALLMRMYLMQGIVGFHKGDLKSASNLFEKAESLLVGLQVHEGKLHEVIKMGYTEKEARLGLRAMNGNVPRAVDYIMETKKKIDDEKKKAVEEWSNRVRGKRLGRTAGGETVSVEHYDSLLGMDFPPVAAAEALRQANNDINLAIEILYEKPELLTLSDPGNENINITNDMIVQVMNMGFGLKVSIEALRQCRGNVHVAVDTLLRNGGVLLQMTEPGSGATSAPKDNSKKLNQAEINAVYSIVKQISTDTDSHLDLTLTEEKDFLEVYQGMLKSMI